MYRAERAVILAAGVNNDQLYRHDLALLCHPQDCALGIRAMYPDDVIEIDALDELAAIGRSYSGLVG